MEYTAYDVKAKKKVKIQNPKVLNMKNGRYAVTGTSSASGIKVFKILSAAEAKEAAKK